MSKLIDLSLLLGAHAMGKYDDQCQERVQELDRLLRHARDSDRWQLRGVPLG